MTPDGHVARLETDAISGLQDRLAFLFRGASNLHSPAAPHMRPMVVTFIDGDHFSEKWTKTENGKDTVFDLQFVRR
jgi:general stress protein 26